MDDPDRAANQARTDAHRAHRTALAWWIQIPIVCGGYLAISADPWPMRIMFAYLAAAAVSIIAIAVTYEAKANAAEATAASYDNP